MRKDLCTLEALQYYRFSSPSLYPLNKVHQLVAVDPVCGSGPGGMSLSTCESDPMTNARIPRSGEVPTQDKASLMQQ